MNKVKTLADLKKMKSELQAKVELREKGENPEGQIGRASCRERV